MKKELVYEERQRFNQWWIIIVFILPFICIFIPMGIIQLGTGKPVGDKPMSDVELIVVMIIFFLLIVFLAVIFFFMRLDTVINKDGVYERMFPFQLKFGFTPWENITDASVIKVKPFSKFRGKWKMKYGITGNKIFTTSGNRVLQLTLKNNKKIVIGTLKPEELTEFLVKINAERKQK